MPLYEYLCQECQGEVELLVRSADEALECPECGSSKLSKLLSVPAAHSGESPGPPPGPCGSACGCFPDG